MVPVRSLNFNEPAYIQFQNRTHRDIDIVWINYSGSFEKYVTLKATENVNIDTFATHPWMFVDRKTGAKMLIGSRTIFYPPSNREVTRRLGIDSAEKFRIPFEIRLPVFTLRQISLQNVLNMLKNINDVDSLQLPVTLRRDIRRLSAEKMEVLSRYDGAGQQD